MSALCGTYYLHTGAIGFGVVRTQYTNEANDSLGDRVWADMV